MVKLLFGLEKEKSSPIIGAAKDQQIVGGLEEKILLRNKSRKVLVLEDRLWGGYYLRIE